MRILGLRCSFKARSCRAEASTGNGRSSYDPGRSSLAPRAGRPGGQVDMGPRTHSSTGTLRGVLRSSSCQNAAAHLVGEGCPCEALNEKWNGGAVISRSS